MRQNIFAAMVQTAASLGIALLSIAIFRFLTPDQVAFLRQHYFVPFALITSLSPANQNYLRSILFSKLPVEDLRRDMDSLAIVQLFTGGTLLAVVLVSVSISGTHLGWSNVSALVVALLLILARTIVTGLLEYRGNYALSIVVNNASSGLPYLAAFSLVIVSEMNGFFVHTIVLNAVGILVVMIIGAKLSTRNAVHFLYCTAVGFRFDFRRYFSLSLISLGSVVIYQGVEFCLYNFTEYDHLAIANYALAFAISAIMRQIILTAVQPLEREQSHTAIVCVPIIGHMRRPVAVELVIYVILVGAVVTMPTIMSIIFPKFDLAGSFFPPLVLGVLGSAIQQVYSVRMIALARSSFLGGTQIALALSCVLAVLLLNSSISILYMIWLISTFVWLRGCLVIPLYAELRDGRCSALMWGARILLSAILYLYLI